MKDHWSITALEWAVRTARAARAQKLVWRLKNRAIVGAMRRQHVDVLHLMRRLGVQMTQSWDRDQDTATNLAQRIATECCKSMGYLLEIPQNKIHCCIKVMTPRASPRAMDRVSTWVRSDPFDDRDQELGDDNAHIVTKNTVWCALLGKNDGVTNWRPFNTFSCNDLTNAGDSFKCTRDGWPRYYRSTLVFPLRYPRNGRGDEFGHLGFLAFDSPDSGAFRDIPDIFKYREDPADYKEHLDVSAAFHLGATFADTLGALIGPAYESNSSQF